MTWWHVPGIAMIDQWSDTCTRLEVRVFIQGVQINLILCWSDTSRFTEILQSNIWPLLTLPPGIFVCKVYCSQPGALLKKKNSSLFAHRFVVSTSFRMGSLLVAWVWKKVTQSTVFGLIVTQHRRLQYKVPFTVIRIPGIIII